MSTPADVTNTIQPRRVPSLEYSALEKVTVPKPVDRIAYVVAAVRGRRVLDLGALDETAYQAKGNTGTWLHKEMAQVAAKLIGVDNSKLVPAEGLHLFGTSGIYLGDINQLAPVIERHGIPEVIVAGEIIEHLPDTLTCLRNLKRDCASGDPLVIITTPNACSWHNFVLGLVGRESMHKDHLHVYSYKCLNTLFERAGFREWTISPYNARFTEMIQASTGAKRLATVMFQSLINFLERRCPMLSGGWVCEIRL